MFRRPGEPVVTETGARPSETGHKEKLRRQYPGLAALLTAEEGLRRLVVEVDGSPRGAQTPLRQPTVFRDTYSTALPIGGRVLR